MRGAKSSLTFAGLVALSLVALPASADPAGTCAFGYNPDALSNVCVNAVPGVPQPSDQTIICVIGNLCVPTLPHVGDFDVYVEALGSPVLQIHCHATDSGPCSPDGNVQGIPQCTPEIRAQDTYVCQETSGEGGLVTGLLGLHKIRIFHGFVSLAL